MLLKSLYLLLRLSIFFVFIYFFREIAISYFGIYYSKLIDSIIGISTTISGISWYKNTPSLHIPLDYEGHNLLSDFFYTIKLAFSPQLEPSDGGDVPSNFKYIPDNYLFNESSVDKELRDKAYNRPTIENRSLNETYYKPSEDKPEMVTPITLDRGNLNIDKYDESSSTRPLGKRWIFDRRGVQRLIDVIYYPFFESLNHGCCWHIQTFYHRNGGQTFTVRNNTYNLPYGTKIRYWTPELLNLFSFKMGNTEAIVKDNKAMYKQIAIDLFRSSAISYSNTTLPPNYSPDLIPVRSVEETSLLQRMLLEKYKRTFNPCEETINNFLKNLKSPYNSHSQYLSQQIREDKLAPVTNNYQDSNNPRPIRLPSVYDNPAVVLAINNSNNINQQPSNINQQPSNTNQQSNNGNEQSNNGKMLLLLTLKSNKYISFLYSKVKSYLSLTSLYVIVSLCLMGIIAKTLLINLFILDMSHFWVSYFVCVPTSFIIINLKSLIINKISKNDYLKCITYQTLIFISLVNILFIIFVCLLIII